MLRQASRLLLGLALVPVALSACQVVAGIEERKLDPNAGTEQLCGEYCDKVMAACTGDNAVYKNRDQCIGVCSKLPAGEDQEDVNENSIHCRLKYAESAKLEPDDCKFAGPGGNGQCGTDCDAYCAVYPQVCPKDFIYADQASCIKACNGLIDQKTYNLTTDHGGDTIECRLVHTSSATVEPVEHCPHATIVPAEPWCIGKKTAAPTCEEYCKIELSVCDEKLTQYENNDQCVAVCEALPIGTNADETGNSIGCRRYHSFNSALVPATHCPHSGPSGDGHCGGNCEAYCDIAANACALEFGTTFGEAQKCLDACATWPESENDSVYTLASAETSKGYQCRMLHLVRAAVDTTQCAAALSGSDCK